MSAGLIDYTVVVPTTGRESLGVLLAALEDLPGPQPAEVLVVDDRRCPPAPLEIPRTSLLTRVVRSGGHGPAAARNAGWQETRTEWVVFLDDDVAPGPDWKRALRRDIGALPDDVGASQGRIEVPLPRHRRATDWERGTAGRSRARWITADMAYRRGALTIAGGFDEEFPRAFREDADLALRVQAMGYRIVSGTRATVHPVRPAGFLAGVRAQVGNQDNAIMRRKHGRTWRAAIGEGPGRPRKHLLVTASLVATGVLALAGRGRPKWTKVSAVTAGVWFGMTAEFAALRIAPGPRDPAEVARMLFTSALIPPVATWHRLRGELRQARRRRRHRKRPAVVLFDRDDTLIHDVPHNGDPACVRPVAGVRAALDLLRTNGIRVGVVSDQSGVARGLVDESEVAAVNREVERHLGPFGTWQVCVHGDADGCDCRKPAPGLIERAAAELHVPTSACVVIGDTGADVDAASAAGARAILVPTERTLAPEIQWAWQNAEVARTVPEAVTRILAEAAR
ncbi:HAD-IIIA family hydrolase [Saccharopolyspora erythraea]|uniref:HAD-IIIA family hydrolase n=1 Tax=Saccharopolyspora erythraea TaxID=1836 RepID=UPI001BAB1C4C|nr:HAD-IIIA family hydrolase [Saccharopolyspora erythraea]QUH00650.1 HAD-IIIA family hydrolase [Saccharopolyspora erythraea]